MLKHLSSLTIALFVAALAIGQTSIYNSQTSSTPRKAKALTKTSTVGYANDHAVHDHSSHDHGEKCGQYSKTQALMDASSEYRMGVEAFREQNSRILAEFESGDRSAPPVYTIPVVFHVIHKGESVGSGTNISDAQLESAIDALNRDYRRTNEDGGIALGAGPDTEIQFCLAGVDPQGNPHSGINRVNGTGVSGYASSGITNSNEGSVKALSRWDNRYYLNIWVVSEIENNGADVSNPSNFFGGTLGYAYLPVSPIIANANLDGIVAINLCVGNDPNQTNGYRLWPWGGLTNRTLTHEVGHYLGLNHVFSDSNPFSCLNGDGIGDTPNAQQININNCNDDGPCNQQIENYMDYTPEQCQDQFTSGQTSVMRATLTGTRSALVNTNNCGIISSNNYDAGISAIIAPSGALCSTTFTPQVTLTNYGSNTLTAVQIAYAVDGQAQTPFNWTGNLTSGSSISFTLPPVTSTAGAHTFTSNVVSGTLNGSNADEDGSNNGSTSSFNIGSGGTGVTITIELDCWGEETTWEIRNASNAVVASGGPYTNDLPGGAGTQVATTCLDNGCYDFNIFDSEGDGLYGSQWSNCDVDGDYMIVDDSQNMLVQMTTSQGDFGASATHNFCIGGGGNPGTPDCEILASFDGLLFDVNANDEPNFEALIIDNDQETVNSAISGYSSNWMTGWYNEVAPGDTNWFLGSTSWHQNTAAPADNWLTFGPVTMLSGDGELRWKHMMSDNDYRDGYEVLVGTVGTDVVDFAGATQLFSVSDNDPSTNGDTIMTQQTVSLPAGTYANQSLYFAIHHDALNMFLLFIDDIEVEGCTAVTVGVEEESEFEMKVFPNPSSNDFTFQYNNTVSEDMTFEVFNSVGQKVWDLAVQDRSQGVETISTDKMAAGVYTLVVRSDSFNVSERLILTK